MLISGSLAYTEMFKSAQDWEDIVAIACSHSSGSRDTILGVKSDGSVLVSGESFTSEDLIDWKLKVK